VANNCQGCRAEYEAAAARIPLCERHAAELKKTDHERVMDALK
jgi:hypothetical protein